MAEQKSSPNEEKARLEQELETLAVAGQLAGIDRLRQEPLASSKTFALAG